MPAARCVSLRPKHIKHDHATSSRPIPPLGQRVAGSGWLPPRFHSFRVPSTLPERTVPPSGENATDCTMLECPRSCAGGRPAQPVAPAPGWRVPSAAAGRRPGADAPKMRRACALRPPVPALERGLQTSSLPQSRALQPYRLGMGDLIEDRNPALDISAIQQRFQLPDPRQAVGAPAWRRQRRKAPPAQGSVAHATGANLARLHL